MSIAKAVELLQGDPTLANMSIEELRSEVQDVLLAADIDASVDDVIAALGLTGVEAARRSFVAEACRNFGGCAERLGATGRCLVCGAQRLEPVEADSAAANVKLVERVEESPLAAKVNLRMAGAKGKIIFENDGDGVKGHPQRKLEKTMLTKRLHMLTGLTSVAIDKLMERGTNYTNIAWTKGRERYTRQGLLNAHVYVARLIAKLEALNVEIEQIYELAPRELMALKPGARHKPAAYHTKRRKPKVPS